ncbi:DUF6518 family protein [Amycolatopsis sp. NPDC059657]|uniref:DUF6518 family protein n=1 Tax=Amycolatopsis sp. NPDC059657 TaxID=3346899 RepID=UPI00366E8772
MINSLDSALQGRRNRRPWGVIATLVLIGLPVGALSKIVDYASPAVAEAGNGFGPYLLILLPFLLNRDTHGFWLRVFATQAFAVAICAGYYAAAYLGDGSFTMFFIVVWLAVGIVGSPMLAALTRSVVESDQRKASLSCGALCGVFVAELVLLLVNKLPGRVDETIVLIPINNAAIVYLIYATCRSKKAHWLSIFLGAAPVPVLFWMGIHVLRFTVAFLRP